MLLQQCSACLVCLIWMVLEMGDRMPCSWFFVGCCFQDLFNIARRILVQFASSVLVEQPLRRIDIILFGKITFYLSDRSDFHMIDIISIAVYAFAWRILMSFSVDEMLLPKYVSLSTNFKETPFSVERYPFLLKHMYSVLSAFTWRPMPLAACSRLCSKDPAWLGVFARSVTSSA